MSWAGGGRRARTDGLFNAIEALSQLSYTPTGCEIVPGELLERALTYGCQNDGDG